MSVQSGAPASLLQTQLAEDAVFTTSGKSLPLSALYEDSEPPSDFPKPSANAMSLKSPETWLVTLDTNDGPFQMKVHRAWSPNGADRFYSLVRNNFYDGVRETPLPGNRLFLSEISLRPEIDNFAEIV